MTVTPSPAADGGNGPGADAVQNVYFPGWPIVAMSVGPARAPPIRASASATARPTQALAGEPGPRPPAGVKPRAEQPCTSTATAGDAVVAAMPSRLNPGSSAARTAATTTGSSAGRHPASTAYQATARTVSSPNSGGTCPRTASGSATPSPIASSRAGDGGTTGSPSPCPAERRSPSTAAGSASSGRSGRSGTVHGREGTGRDTAAVAPNEGIHTECFPAPPATRTCSISGPVLTG